MYPITAQSTPNYDDWGWDQYWNCEDWIAWHKELVKAYGLQQANLRFITAYHQASFGAASYDCRTFNRSFREYARQNGFLDALYQGIGAIMQPVGPVIETGSNILDVAVTTSSMLKKLLPLVFILLVVIGMFYIGKKAQVL